MAKIAPGDIWEFTGPTGKVSRAVVEDIGTDGRVVVTRVAATGSLMNASMAEMLREGTEARWRKATEA